METPLGPFSFTFSEAGVVSCGFRLPDGKLREGEGDLAPLVREQVSAYFSGALRLFTVPLDYGSASSFRRGVYDLVRAIPYGETRSYGEVAEALASGPRAVGQAMGGVPFPLLVPAHRVIMADGSLGGFRGRTDLKAWLLDFERSQ